MSRESAAISRSPCLTCEAPISFVSMSSSGHAGDVDLNMNISPSYVVSLEDSKYSSAKSFAIHAVSCGHGCAVNLTRCSTKERRLGWANRRRCGRLSPTNQLRDMVRRSSRVPDSHPNAFRHFLILKGLPASITPASYQHLFAQLRPPRSRWSALGAQSWLVNDVCGGLKVVHESEREARFESIGAG